MLREYLVELMKGLIILIILISVAVGVIWYLDWCDKEEQRQRAIVNELRPLIDDCKKIGDVPISIYRKCLVWDMENDSRCDAHNRLPRELKASPFNNKVMVFMVMPERAVLVGHYSISREPAYYQYVDVYVAYWPEKKAIGMHSVLSREPPSSRLVRPTPEYGDPIEPIANWIKSLPRVR